MHGEYLFIYSIYWGIKPRHFLGFPLCWLLRGSSAGSKCRGTTEPEEKLLCSHFSSAPPWHLQMILFNEFFSLWQLQSCLPFSLGALTKGTRDFFSMQDILSILFPITELKEVLGMVLGWCG